MSKTAQFALISALALLAGGAAFAGTSQSITFFPIADQMLGVAPFPVTAKASSGLPVTFASLTPSACKVSGGLITLIAAGNCTITASQAGNATYSAATVVAWPFTVRAAGVSGAVTTATNSPFAAGQFPSAVVVADFNGDKLPDLAVANLEDSTITVLLGNGSGSFTAATGSPMAAGFFPYALAVGDFNNDGIPDLVAADTNGNCVTVLVGAGSGQFTPAAGSPFAVGNSPVSVAVADFNGDGIEDLAVANSGDGTVTVLLGNGAAGFTAASGSPITIGGTPDFLAVADFNRDGAADIAVVNLDSNTVSVLLGNGLGGFNGAAGSPFAVGNGPYGVVAADFNGDGIADIASVNVFDNTVTVLLGNGSGGFTAASGSPFAVGPSPTALTVGDFNGDGLTDIATSNSGSGGAGNDVTVLLGNGSGGFTAASVFVGLDPDYVAVGDFNGDHITDLVTANFVSNNVSVLLGGPAATTVSLTTTSPLAIPVNTAVNLSVTVTAPLGDFNALSGTVTILDGNTPLKVFTSGSAVAGVYSFSTSTLAAGTHNLTATYAGDASSSSAVSSVLAVQVFQSGSAIQTITITAPTSVTLGAGTSAVTASTNAPGLTVTLTSTTLSVCTLSGGTLTFLAQGTCTLLGTQAGNGSYAAASATFNITVNPQAQTITFNPPGNAPLNARFVVVLASASSNLAVVLSTSTTTVCSISGSNTVLLVAVGTCTVTASQPGNSTFAAAAPVTQSFSVVATAVSQTITFDAIPNKIFGTAPFPIAARASSYLPLTLVSTTPTICGIGAGIVSLRSVGICSILGTQAGNSAYTSASGMVSFAVLQAKSAGTLNATAGSPYASGGNSVIAADFNGDGIQDLATTSASLSGAPGTVTVLLGNSSGGYTAAKGSPFTVGVGPLALVTGDFNMDGIADLAIANYTDSTITVLLGNGSGSFSPASGSPFAVGAGPIGVVVGDFNNDGIPDLATANYTAETVTVLIGNGFGSFGATGGTPFALTSLPTAIAAGDFNGDSKQDLVVTNTTGSLISVLLGNGSGGFTAATGSVLVSGARPVDVAIGDFDRDGFQDLAIADQASAQLIVLRGNGSGGFALFAGSPMALGIAPNSLTIADLDGDGNQDIAVAGFAFSNNIVVMLGSGSGAFTAAKGGAFTGGQSPTALAAADMNGDGIEDLVTANGVTVMLGGIVSTSLTLSTTTPAITYGQNMPLTAIVTDGPNAFETPTGSVAFSVGSTVLGTLNENTNPYSFTATGLNAGTYVVTATYNGDSHSSGSTAGITVIVAQAAQTISFSAIAAVTLPVNAFALTATASSGLAVTFTSSTASICTVSGSTVTPLAAGTCTVVAAQAGNSNYAAASSVTQSFTVNAASTGGGGGGSGGGSFGGGNPLSVLPASVTISATAGGSIASQTVTLSYQTATQGAPPYTLSFYVNQGSGWLSVSPTSGTMTQASYAGFVYTYTATVTISGNPAGLTAGSSYTGVVNAEALNGIVSIPVTMNITTQPAKFTIAPQSLNFAYQLGNATSPAVQTLSVFSTPTGASFTATAASTGNWLSVGTGAATPQSLTVSVNATGIAAGTYNGTVTIASGTAVNISVPVTLTVVAASPPSLGISPALQNLAAAQGGAAALGQITVSNSGGGTLQYSSQVTAGGAWLKVIGASTGSALPGAPASLVFSATPGTLTPGVYNGQITVSDVNSSAQVTAVVVLIVTGAAPQLQLSNTGVTLTAIAGGAAPQAQTVVVSNTGSGSLAWTVQTSTTQGGNWLTVTPGTGTSTGGQTGMPVSIGATTTGLPAGTYYGSVNLVASNAVNSPQSIFVALNVLAATADPGISVSAGGILLTGKSGATTAVSQNVTLFNAASAASSYTASTYTQNGASWLSVSPASGTLSAGANTLSIAANFSGLTAGVQSGNVTLAFADGSTATIGVTALIVGTSAGSIRTAVQPKLSVTTCAAGKAAFLIPVVLQPLAGSALPAASPATIQVKVIDDCGNAVTAAGGGAVQATFSSGDPGVALSDTGAGVWEATWTPSRAAASVAIQAVATENGLAVNSSLASLGSVTVSVAAAGANSPPQPTGIANAASAGQATAGVVAPLSYVAIYGTGLAANGSPSAANLPLPTTLNGTQLLLGGIPMPLLYASAGQVNALVPEGIAPNATYPLTVLRGSTPSVPVPITVTELQPGTYTVNTTGSGAGIVTNALTGQSNSASSPAHVGDYLVIYATGLGSVIGASGQVEPADGAAASSSVVYSTTAKVTATIGGISTPVLFSGLTPTFAGLYQVNVQVPAGVASGSAVPVVLTATDPATGYTASGNTTTIVVQ